MIDQHFYVNQDHGTQFYAVGGKKEPVWSSDRTCDVCHELTITCACLFSLFKMMEDADEVPVWFLSMAGFFSLDVFLSLPAAAVSHRHSSCQRHTMTWFQWRELSQQQRKTKSFLLWYEVGSQTHNGGCSFSLCCKCLFLSMLLIGAVGKLTAKFPHNCRVASLKPEVKLTRTGNLYFELKNK